MLTRFKVSGFKNLENVDISFGPFICVAGSNAVGKSNLFDAMMLLSFLAEHPFLKAFSKIRSTVGNPDNNVKSSLSNRVISGEKNLILEANLLIPPTVVDDFGQVVPVPKQFLSYRLELHYEPESESMKLPGGTLSLVDESIRPLKNEDLLPWQQSIVGKFLHGNYQKPFLSVNDGTATAQNGKRGPNLSVPTEKTQRTVLSALASAELPALLGVREELKSWRFIALEPSAMRSPDNIMETESVNSVGAHIPATLYRLDKVNPDRQVYFEAKDIVSDLVDVQNLRVVDDSVRQTLELRATVGYSPELPARSLSDGTLRFLALVAMEMMDEYCGLIAMEEPENGIHPGKIPALLNLLLDLSTERNDVLRQVVINTHSPYLVQEIAHQDTGLLRAAYSFTRKNPDSTVTSSTTFNPIRNPENLGESSDLHEGSAARSIPLNQLIDFLRNPAMETEDD